MARYVICELCKEYVTSPPPDNCPHCGTAYDPEVVRVQREVHGGGAGEEGETSPEAAPASGTAAEADPELAEFLRKAEAGELTLDDLVNEDLVAIAAENFGLEVPEGTDREGLLSLIREAAAARLAASQSQPQPEPKEQPTPRAKRTRKAAAGE